MIVIIVDMNIGVRTVNPEKGSIQHNISKQAVLSKKINTDIAEKKVERRIYSSDRALKLTTSNAPNIQLQKQRNNIAAVRKAPGKAHNISTPQKFSIRDLKAEAALPISIRQIGKPRAAAVKLRSPKKLAKRQIIKLEKGQIAAPRIKTAIKRKLLKADTKRLHNVVRFDNPRLRIKPTAAVKYNKVCTLKRLKLSRKKYSLRAAAAPVKTSVKAISRSAEKVKGGLKNAVVVAEKTAAISSVVTKPVSVAGNKLLSQRADFSKSGGGETGTETVKLGLQTPDYARRGVRGMKTAVQAPRKIYKTAKNTVNYTKRTIQTSAKVAKNTAKAAKATAKIAAKAVKFTAKAAAQAAKAAAQVVQKVVSLIAETSPWSLIVIAAILVVILLIFIIMYIVEAIAGTTAGVAGWAIPSDHPEGSVIQNEDIYDNILSILDDVNSAYDDVVRQPLKSIVDSFCSEGDNIIEYDGENGSVSETYPARWAKTSINGYLDDSLIDPEEVIAVLYVLMTREKLSEENIENEWFSPVEFTVGDFKDVFGDTSRFDPSLIYQNVSITHYNTCPDEDCSLEYLDDSCASSEISTDSGSEVSYYCEGHDCCPGDHDKMSITLCLIEKKYDPQKTLAEIFEFTDNDKDRYDMCMAFIQMMKTYGGETSETNS